MVKYHVTHLGIELFDDLIVARQAERLASPPSSLRRVLRYELLLEVTQRKRHYNLLLIVYKSTTTFESSTKYVGID